MSVNERLANLEAASTTIEIQRPQVPANVTNVTNVTQQVVSKPVSITGSVVFTGTTSTVAWTTVDLSLVIPAGVYRIELETEWSMSAPDVGTVDAYVRVRKHSTAPERVAVRGRAAGASDDIAGCEYCVVDVTKSRTFDYTIDTAFAAFNGGVTMRVVGYWR